MTRAADLLVETARRGELHHAMIVHGPNPAALRELAARIARTLNCLNGSTGDDCVACQKVDRRLHPDVHFIEVAPDKKFISIEQIRDVVSAATLRPYEGRTKVFIIDPADAITPNGSNALLKTLEEPTRDTTFVLLTRAADQLLPTIRSRSHAIHVGDDPPPAGTAAAEKRLRQIGLLDPSERRELAATMATLLRRFAGDGDASSLLALAVLAAGHEATTDAIALLALVLTSPGDQLGPTRERRLAAADALIVGIDAIRKVNADARLVVEGALARLVVGPEQ